MLEEFIKLYMKSVPVSKLGTMDDINYKTFILKKGLPVTLVQTSKCVRELYPLKSFYGFFEKHPYFWMIPIANPSLRLNGFIIRGFAEKEYRTIFDYGNLPPMFGFEDFKDFKLDKPLIICEGVKDSIYLKTLYPYVLALNTSNITSANLEILSLITNKIIIAYDNDKTGISCSKVDRETLLSKGIMCETVVPRHKDCAEFVGNKQGESEFVDSVNRTLRLLGGLG